MLREKLPVIIISLILGLAAAGIFYGSSVGKNLFGKKNTAPITENTRTVTVVTAATDIDRRTKIKAEMLKTKSVSADSVHPEAVTDMKTVLGHFTEEKLIAGEILLAPKISKTTAPGELSYAVPAGKRAITVSVSAASGVGNMLRPGDRVDVLAYLNDRVAGEDVLFTLLEDVMVLAIDTKTGLEKDSKIKDKVTTSTATAPEYKTVTLAVDPKESGMLGFAESVGEIKLVLHGTKDGDMPAFRQPISPKAIANAYGFKIKEQKNTSTASPAPAAATAPAYPAAQQPAAAPAAPAQSATAPVKPQPADPDKFVYTLRGSELSAIELAPDDNVKKNGSR